MEDAYERDQQVGVGLSLEYASLTDLALILFDYANVAKKSTGVNDEFQFGFLTN